MTKFTNPRYIDYLHLAILVAVIGIAISFYFGDHKKSQSCKLIGYEKTTNGVVLIKNCNGRLIEIPFPEINDVKEHDQKPD